MGRRGGGGSGGGRRGGGAGGAAATSLVRERMERARQMEYIHNPHSQDARQYLQDRFGIAQPQPPLERSQLQASKRPAATGQRVAGKVTKPNRLLPAKNRGDPGAPPPPIDERDINQGLLSLVNRGLIPANVDLSAAFARGAAPVTQQPAAFHDRGSALYASQRPAATANMYGFNMSNIKLDVRPPAAYNAATMPGVGRARRQQNSGGSGGPGALREQKLSIPGRPSPPPQRGMYGDDLRGGDGGYGGQLGQGQGQGQQPQELSMDVERIRGYNELLDEYSLHQFIIRKGRVLADTPEFKSYRRTNEGRWGGILRVVEALEDLLTLFAVPMAFIDGQAVARLAQDELAQLTTDRLLACIANVDQVQTFIRIPGRRFVHEGGTELAATLVQSTYRAHRCRRRYGRFLLERDATLTIQRRWKQWQAMAHARGLIRQRRIEDAQKWRRMREGLAQSWDAMKTKRRTVIHIHSLSRDEHHRLGIPHFPTRQNLQMARLCSVADPRVDVIYVAPFEINDDVRSYYTKLLEVGGVADADTRIKFVVPENLHRFPEHLSLSAALLYSPRALRQIRRYVKGKAAYIVPGVVGPEDKTLSLYLGLPMVGPDPGVAAVLGSKSGSKRIFAAADVNIPVGAHDVYEEGELFATVAKLVAAYPDVRKWLVKIDDEWGGRGHCLLDVSSQPDLRRIVAELQAERAQFTRSDPAYWGRQDVQETARKRLMQEVPAAMRRHAVLAGGGGGGGGADGPYPDWRRFVAGIERAGCVVEAVPNELLGSPSASIFIEPTGKVSVVATHEQLFSTPFRYCGAIFPQQSVPHAAIRGAATAVGLELHKKGVYGHVGIDFAAFWDTFSDAKRLWAVDLNPQLTRSTATFVFFNFLMGGSRSRETGEYFVDPDPDRAVRARKRRARHLGNSSSAGSAGSSSAGGGGGSGGGL